MRFRDFHSDAFRQPGPLLRSKSLKSKSFKSKSWARNLSCLAVLAVIPSVAGVSQAITGNDIPIHDSSGLPPANPLANPTADPNRFMEDSMRLHDNQKRIAMLNVLRQKEMTTDTAKLVQLAHQVKAEATLNGKDSLSVVELRQVEAIEKLARGVKDKMEANVAR
jgi:hypothetical protein